MSEPTGCAGGCPRTDTHDDTYCDRCDLLVGLPGLRVIKVHADGRRLVVTVESPRVEQGCRSCGVIAGSHGRRTVRLVDAPCFGRPVRVVWRKRTWACEEPSCEVGVFTEQHDQVARPRGLLTTRACWWAIKQLRFEHASVLGLARQLRTTWRTLWRSIEPLLQEMADDPARFDGVTSLGVDEHIWHHVDERQRGPKALTGMVDLSRDQAGRTRARLLDLVPGRSGKAYADWLEQRGDAFRRRVAVATLDPFHGYKNAIDDQLQDAVSVLDAFHVVKLGGQVVDRVRADSVELRPDRCGQLLPRRRCKVLLYRSLGVPSEARHPPRGGPRCAIAGGMILTARGREAMKLLTRYALSAAVLSLCALAACGNPSSNDPASGRTLVVDKAFDLKTADPARNFETTGNILGRAIYDTLVTFKPGDSSTPVPQLATEWKSNADATTYTFRLREGVTFTNGDALTAEDVVFSLMRVKNIKANGAFLMDGLTVRAVDPQTVKIISDKPNAAIPSIMSSPTLGILNSKAVREKGGTDAEGADKADTAETFLNTTSAGSGPFKLESFSTTTETNLVPNPKYWGARPPFPKVVLRNASAATQVQDLTSGNGHVALDIGSDQVSSLKGNSSLEINTTPSPTVIFLFANANPKISAVTSNAAFREAVKYGVDYDSLLDLAGAGAVRASSMIPTSFLGALEEGAATKRDTARAAAAVKKLGSISDITLEYPSDVTVGGLKLGPIAERLQANLAEVGLKIKLAPAPISTALDHYRGGTEEMGLWLWNPDFPDPADYLVFGPGDIVGKRAGWQVSDAPDVAEVATTARTTADKTERATLYKNFMTGINEAAVINPLFQPSATIVASKSLPKVTFSPVYVLDITTIGQ